jgi:hypothetical protein
MNSENSGFITSAISQRTKDIGQNVLDTSKSVRTVAEQLRNDPITAKAADVADYAASMIENLGQYLNEKDVLEMMSDAEKYSRERPVTVALGAFAIGVSAARVLKAGASRRALAAA